MNTESTKEQIEEAAIKLATSAFPDLHPNSIGYIVLHASGQWTNASKWHLNQLAKITGERDEARAACAVKDSLLRAFRYSMDRAVPFPSLEKLNAALSLAIGTDLIAERDRYKSALQMKLQLMKDTGERDCYCDDGTCWPCVARKALNPTPKDV